MKEKEKEVENWSNKLLKHVESGLSSQSKDWIKVYSELSTITVKAQLKPATVTKKDFDAAMSLVDKLNVLTR
jgi:hypothetical protein